MIDNSSDKEDKPKLPIEEEIPVKLFVGSLPYDVNEEDIVSIFTKFGEITELAILRDKLGRSRGCAALRFSSNDAAEACIQTLHNRYCCGNVPTPLQVRYFEKREVLPTTCFVDGLPYCFSPNDLWTSLSETYGPVMNISMDVINQPYSAYVSFYKKSSAYAFSNEARASAAYIGGLLCPSVRVTIIKYSTAASLPPASLPSNANPAPSVVPPAVTAIPNGGYGYPIPSPVGPHIIPGYYVYPPFIQPSSPTLDLSGDKSTTAVNESSATENDNSKSPSAASHAKLFVGCLPYSKTAQDIADLFAPFGTLLEVAILTDYNGRSRGAAFVTFSSCSEANKAMEELSEFCFPKSTRPINISYGYKQ